MKATGRRWVVCLIWALLVAQAKAQVWPWNVPQSAAQAKYKEIEYTLQNARYAEAHQLLLGACKLTDLTPAEKLVFLGQYEQERVATAHDWEAFVALRAGHKHLQGLIDTSREARAFLLGCYADLAIDIQLQNPRRVTVKALEAAWAQLDTTSAQRQPIARRIAVLYRMLKELPTAQSWFTIAQGIPNQQCGERLSLSCEELVLALKNADTTQAKSLIAEARSLLQGCKEYRREDVLLFHLVLAEFHRDIAAMGVNPERNRLLATESLQTLMQDGDAYPEIRSAHLYNGLANLGMIVRESGDLDSTIKLCQRAADGLLARAVAPKSLVNAYMNLGECCHYLGRIDDAVQYYHLAILHYPRHIAMESLNESKRYIDMLTNYGQELITNENYAEGESYLRQAIDLLMKTDSSDGGRLGNLYLNLAVSYDMQGSSAAAAEYYIKAAELHPENYPRVAPHAGTQARFGAATQYLQLHDLQAADAQLQLGIAAMQKLPSSIPLAHVFPLLDLANYYRLSGNLPLALKTNDRLLETVLFGYTATNRYDCPDLENYLTPWYTLEAVDQRMQIFWAMYRQSHDQQLLPPIVQCGQKALSLLRRLRQERNTEGDKLKLNEKWRDLYENTLRAAVELYELTHDASHLATAFETAEQSKAMMLMEAVVENQALEGSTATAGIAAERRSLQAQMNDLRLSIAEERNADGLLHARQELLALQSRHDSLLSHLKTANPKYFDLVYEFDVVTIPKLQEQLRRDDRCLVEYFYGDSLIYTLVVNPETLVVLTYKPTDAFVKALQDLTHFLHDHPEAGDLAAATEYGRLSQTVTAAIWQPISKLLRPRITIVPDGPLSYISFEALVAEQEYPAHPKFQDFNYLLEQYTISYHYSATFYCAPDAPLPGPHRSLLAIAPTFEGTEELPALPASAEGVKALADAFGQVDVLTGEEATKQAFLKQAGHHNIIDLATHGKYDKRNFLNSRIYFSPDGSGDSLVYLRELYALNLPSELAILEACETGLGDYHQGEGVMSLARGFTYAGCQSVLMSLWEVSEGESTQRIIGGFYDRLAEGQPRDEAIAASKRAYLQAIRAQGGTALGQIHPFYWSELVLIGQHGPIALERQASGNGWLWWLGGGLLILAGLGIWRWRMRAA